MPDNYIVDHLDPSYVDVMFPMPSHILYTLIRRQQEGNNNVTITAMVYLHYLHSAARRNQILISMLL